MGNLKEHPASHIVRLLNIGESGTGKTGALASLAKAGYHLWILDYDNGLDILANLLSDDPEAMERVTYRSLRDKITLANGIPKILGQNVSAWKDAGKTLEEWEASVEGGKFGPLDILVIDTLTTMSMAAFNEALKLGARLNSRPQQNDYGWMADTVLLFMQAITEEDANFNLIVNTHVRYLSAGEDDTANRGLPNAKGQQIPKDIGKFFNTIVLTRTQGSGPGARRLISTQPQGVIEVKTSNPKGVKPSYQLEEGLAQLFHDILGHGPTA